MIAGSDKIGLLAAELMEAIEAEELPDGASNARVGAVAIVVEVEAESEHNEHGITAIKFRCSDTRGWVQAGLLTAASDAARNWGTETERED